MSLIDLGASITSFFEAANQSPAHDELDRAFTAAKLSMGDPGPGGNGRVPWGGVVRGRSRR